MSQEYTRERFEIEDEHANHHHGQESSSLPAVDGGWAAWLFLTGSFMIETLIWGMCLVAFRLIIAYCLAGFPFSFGVLQDYYTTHEPFSSHAQGVSAIGTTCSGIMYCAAPLLFAVYTKYPHFVRQSTFIGLPIVALAIFLSSFATSIWHLTLTQGVMYAIGGGLLYYPVFIFIDEWFVRRKGFAFGVMWAGSGCGGLSGPLVLDWGLNRYGAKVFLRGWAVALVCVNTRTLSESVLKRDSFF
jgi:hypothetical protein